MQRIVIDEPYEFIPPHRGQVWPRLLRHLIPGLLRRGYGVVSGECHGVEHLRRSLDAGHGIVLASNHCRPSDPLVLDYLARDANTLIYIIASWHVFMQSKWTRFMIRRVGAFSIYREGMDRSAIQCAVEILEKAERPLVIFPEGVISRANDRLGPLMEGTALIARRAADLRAKKGGKVVIHPIAMRYHLEKDIHEALSPKLDEMEARFTWQHGRDMSLFERIHRLGRGLLSLKEIEYLGDPQPGTVSERLAGLIDHLLRPLEDEWTRGKRKTTSVVSRVKAIRTAILRDMVGGELPSSERERRWGQLANLYLAQQLSFYPTDYLEGDVPPERYLETVERFEEDLTDKVDPAGDLRVVLQVGEAIEVDPQRVRGSDPVMDALQTAMDSMLRV